MSWLKSPYWAVAIFLLNLAGWALAYVLDRELNAPIAEYVVSLTPKKDGTTHAILELTNLTTDKTFKNARLIIRRESGQADLRIIQPTWNLEPVAPYFTQAEPTTDPNSVVLLIDQWPPGATMRLEGDYEGSATPMIQMQQGDEPFRFVAAGIRTWLVGHALGVLITAIAVLVVSALVTAGAILYPYLRARR